MAFTAERQSFVEITVDQLGVALIKICRPEKRNALSQSVIDDLVNAIEIAEKNHEVRAVVLTGSTPNGPFSGTYKLWKTEAASRSSKYGFQNHKIPVKDQR